MGKTTFRKHIIRDQMYGRDIEVWIGGTEGDFNREVLNKKYKGQHDELVGDGTDGLVATATANGKIKYLMWLRSFDWKLEEQGTLAHEVFHLTMQILKDLGISYCEESDEAFAYYMEHLYFKCIKALHI